MAGSRSWAGNTLVGAPGRNYRLSLDFWDIREGGINALGEWGYFPRQMQDAQWRFGYLGEAAAAMPVEHGTGFGLDSALPADAIVVCLPFRLWIGSGDAIWQTGWYGGNPVGAGVWQVQAGQSIAQAQQQLTNRIGRLDFLKDVTPEEMPVFQLQVGDSGNWELLVDIDRNGEIDIDVTSAMPGNRPSDYTGVTQAGGLWITTGAAGGIRAGRVGRSPMTLSYAETPRETVPAELRDRRPLEVAIPDSSIVSPVTVEGRRWNANYRVFQEASTLPETREVQYLDARKFISTVPLSAETAAQVSYTQDCIPQAVKEGAIAWQALDLSDPATAGLLLSLRVGETVLLTASGSGSLLQIEINGTVFTGVPGQLFTYTAGEGGTHTVTAWIDGEEIGSLEIAVVEVTLPERILCQIGKTVQAVVELGPGVDFDDFTFTAADPALLDVSVKTNRGSRVELNLRARQRGTPVLEVRRKADNSLVAAREIEEFILENSSQYSLKVNPVTRTGYVTLTFKPWVTNIVVSMYMFASQATFGGGLTEYIMTDVDFIPVWNPETEEYEAFGEFAIELPSWENYYCYNVTVLGIPSNYQGTIAELLGGEGDKAGGGHINANAEPCCTCECVGISISGPDEIGVNCSKEFTVRLNGDSRCNNNYSIVLSDDGTFSVVPQTVSLRPNRSTNVTVRGLSASTGTTNSVVKAMLTACNSSAEHRFTVVDVTFDMDDPHKVAISAGDNDRTQKRTATVKPPESVTNITLSASGRLSIGNISNSNGVIFFDMVGLNKSIEQGDAWVKASHPSGCEWKQDVSVIVPADIEKPEDLPGGVVEGVNYAINESTSPASFNTPTGQVELVTMYGHWMTLQVLDQFGDSIDDLYENAVVEEQLGGVWGSINQPVSATGTYLDPVGHPARAFGYFDENGIEALTWPDASPLMWSLAGMNRTITNLVDVPVRIDGFGLSPGLEGRSFVIYDDNHGVYLNPDSTIYVDILWP